MMDRVLTIGTFDVLHEGHMKLINRCKDMGELLVVGVNSDEFVESYKGKPPIMTEKERISTLKAFYGDLHCHINKDKGRTLIKDVAPCNLVIGTDWLRKDYLKQIGVTVGELEEWKVNLIYVPRTEGISTTELKKRIGR